MSTFKTHSLGMYRHTAQTCGPITALQGHRGSVGWGPCSSLWHQLWPWSHSQTLQPRKEDVAWVSIFVRHGLVGKTESLGNLLAACFPWYPDPTVGKDTSWRRASWEEWALQHAVWGPQGGSLLSIEEEHGYPESPSGQGARSDGTPRRVTGTGPMKDVMKAHRQTQRDCEACWRHKDGSTSFCSPLGLKGCVRNEDGAWSWQSGTEGRVLHGSHELRQTSLKMDRQTETHQPLKSISVQFYCKRESLSHFRSTEFVKIAKGS